MDRVYLSLAVVGFAIPYWVFTLWLLDNGINLTLLWQNIIDHPISLFAWLDVVIAAIALIAFVIHQREKYLAYQVKSVVLTTCLVGVSCALPLMLYFHETNKNKG